MSILIVADKPDELNVLQTMLTEARRWNIMAAGTIHDALRIVESGGIHLILTDLMAPGMGGLEVCRRIQERPELCHVPVVVLIKADEREHLSHVYKAGACDYIIKPVHLDEVVARAEAVLRSRDEIARRAARERELLAANRKLETANQELLRLSAVDPVTGVSNRRCFDQTMDRVWRSCARHSLEVALIMIDVDFFKPYNDRLGHPAGDECLRRVASGLTGSLMRPEDFLARYGGEEFAVVLPRTDLTGASLVAERLRTTIQNLGIVHPASPVASHVTISQGLACKIPER